EHLRHLAPEPEVREAAVDRARIARPRRMLRIPVAGGVIYALFPAGLGPGRAVDEVGEAWIPRARLRREPRRGAVPIARRIDDIALPVEHNVVLRGGRHLTFAPLRSEQVVHELRIGNSCRTTFRFVFRKSLL